MATIVLTPEFIRGDLRGPAHPPLHPPQMRLPESEEGVPRRLRVTRLKSGVNMMRAIYITVLKRSDLGEELSGSGHLITGRPGRSAGAASVAEHSKMRPDAIKTDRIGFLSLTSASRCTIVVSENRQGVPLTRTSGWSQVRFACLRDVMGIFGLHDFRRCFDERLFSAASATANKAGGQASDTEPTNESPRSLTLSFFLPRLEQKKERL